MTDVSAKTDDVVVPAKTCLAPQKRLREPPDLVLAHGAEQVGSTLGHSPIDRVNELGISVPGLSVTNDLTHDLPEFSTLE